MCEVSLFINGLTVTLEDDVTEKCCVRHLIHEWLHRHLAVQHSISSSDIRLWFLRKAFSSAKPTSLCSDRALLAAPPAAQLVASSSYVLK